MKRGTLLFFGLLLLSLPAVSSAAEYTAFQQDSVEAYRYYKQVLSLTSKPDTQEKSIATVEKFLSSWKVLADKYKQDVPVPFVALPNYVALLEQPLLIGQRALVELKEGDIKAAHATLEDIRYLLWKMRTEAGLVTLSDKINDFHEVMEIVLDKLHEAKSAETMQSLAKRYGPWMEIKWEELAGVEVFSADRDTFDNSFNDGRAAIGHLLKLMAGGDVNAGKEAGKKVKKAYKSVFSLDSAS